MPRHELTRALCAIVLAASAWLTATDAAAQPTDDPYVPPALEPWVPWVLQGHPELACARLDGGFTCAWPGALELEVGRTRGAFTLEVWRDSSGWMTLPGGDRFWPSEVLVTGRVATVSRTPEGKPRVRVEAGRQRITGQLLWDSPPEFVTVPPEVGRVELSYLGARVERPRRDTTHRLWVREGAGPDEAKKEGEADAMRATIFRTLQDGVPTRVRTLIRLNVSGRAREVDLGQVLLASSRPVGVTSELPLRVDAGGRATVYARPGTHDVEVTAVVPERVVSWSPPTHSGGAEFDRDEVWVWRPDERLRAVNLSGMAMIDPTRTALPESWRGGTTMLAPPGSTLTLEVTRRGEPEPAPNQVSLSRTMWLDLDGEGYTIKDRLSGQMRQGWRLNYVGQGELGRARDTSKAEDLLITQDPDGGETGVELRGSAINLEAEIRAQQGHGTFDAVGWDHDVQRLDATLHLPPGWSVLAARGVDELPGTWVDSWSLFEFFLLLMIAFSMGRLFGWPWGVVSALALLVAHEWRADAPYYVWFHLVAGLALLRVAPPERAWVRWPLIAYVAVSFLTFVTIFVPFAREQIRYGLNPQVERGWNAPMGGYTTSVSEDAEEEWAQETSKFDDGANGIRDIAVSSSLARERASGKKQKASLGYIQQQQIDPNEVVQTGPGLPSWGWNSYALKWSGPVDRAHVIELWLISPAWNMALRFASVALFLLMGLVVIAPGRMTRRRGIFDLFTGMKRVLVPGSGALLAGLLFAPDARAQANPSPETLAELERRVVAARTCPDPCVVATSMDLTIEGRELEVRAEVHAQRDSGWYLPGPSETARLRDVRVDGVPTQQLRRSPGGMIAVRLAPGRHVVTARAELPARDVVTLQLDSGTKPRRVTLQAREWAVDGLDPFGRPDDSLQLSRSRPTSSEPTPDGANGPDEASRELPPFYFVERTLLLGLPWQTRTTVTREDTSRPQLLKLPLLPGEAVITEGVRVEQRAALVDFPRGTSSVTYVSELPSEGLGGERDEVTLELEAPRGKPWTETWRLECSRIWSCSTAGIAPTTTLGASAYEPTWRPWPGESVAITVEKPRATEGQSSTITRVDYTVTPGKRRLLATLSISVRASQGGWREVTLPPEAQLQKVTIDGVEKTLRPDERGKLSLPIRPGSQELDLTWMQPWDREFIERAPEIALDAQATNVTVTMELGEGRWLLWTMGPQWGPTVRFWSHLALLLIAAVLLGRLTHLPLRTHHWLLLAIGMSQLPALGMLPLVVWFSLLVWRRERPPSEWYTFNAYQAGIVFASLVMLGTLYAAVHANLLFDMDMQVSGAGSNNTSLHWYTDRVTGILPTPGVLSVPLLVWRVAMLLWALWLVASLIGWLRWGWKIFSQDRVFMRPEPGPIDDAPPRAPGRDLQATAGGFQRRDGEDGTIGDEERGPAPSPPAPAGDAEPEARASGGEEE